MIERDVTVDDMSHYQPHQVTKKQAVGARYRALGELGRIRPPTERLRVAELEAELPAEVRSGEVAGTRARVAAGKADRPSPS